VGWIKKENVVSDDRTDGNVGATTNPNTLLSVWASGVTPSFLVQKVIPNKKSPTVGKLSVILLHNENPAQTESSKGVASSVIQNPHTIHW
jgi:hypothetical protein